ncbi:hypothetical protein AWC05_00490 [Mycobacterium florentinum]|uniref:Uncharacterized protein n=1 Tax=Mycobacterium florentinum TaxID=292462 RepID=A0A1X1U0I5_MYCFL|nr:hypothetical protein [Mycobacterium florentinum]MCV7412710.1 hypothetical protein [Mycobacterium florentinum]ORV50354.1 hypothetical protein AWC05_00490 [Mycobacterium florentinum]BBX82096.1 hypothetical protein MFLOJ_58830 [Mycobacterium florentinum]
MIVLPRIDRQTALELLNSHLSEDLLEISSRMPDQTPVVTFTPVGGLRIDDQQLIDLRKEVVELACRYGMPGRITSLSVFEGRLARLLHERIPMSLNEASHEEVWSYLTCCWLLDIAVWRFGKDADARRFIGDVNRNTFRRLWWRAAIMGPQVDLTRLGEDELVNITERPTIASDHRLARTVAFEFLDRVDRGEAEPRMLLMRDAMKRLLRLTPFISFAALRDNEVREVVEDCFDAAALALSRESGDTGGRHRSLSKVEARGAHRDVPPVSPGVVAIERMTMTEDEPAKNPSSTGVTPDFENVAQTALGIARRVGSVTNSNLREIVPITSGEAREVLQTLMKEGLLARRGVRRGTYYVLAESAATPDTAWPPQTPTETTELGEMDVSAASSESALRRLLRRVK